MENQFPELTKFMVEAARVLTWPRLVCVCCSTPRDAHGVCLCGSTKFVDANPVNKALSELTAYTAEQAKGYELKALRIKAGYGLWDVASCVGIRAVTLAQIECGEIGSGRWERILRDFYGS